MNASSAEYDVIVVGGGLSGGLLAYRLTQTHPSLNILVIEREKRFGGDHTWSFYRSDLSGEAHDWIEPFVTKSWDQGHEVRFPKFSRNLSASYHSIVSSQFDSVLRNHLKSNQTLLGVSVKSLDFNSVTLETGKRLTTHVVIDARGFVSQSKVKAGFQKFVGLDVELEEPHGLERPVIMDATVEQIDGYRFVYLLPWTEKKLLIEDTYYSNHPELPVETIKSRIQDYAKQKGWKIQGVERVETGVLPIPLEKFYEDGLDSPVPIIGVRSGLFQPITGYSVPFAVKTVERLCRLESFSLDEVMKVLMDQLSDQMKQDRFLLFLNRMLFLGAKDHERYRILERFYRLPESLVERFYFGELTLMDRARILIGKPPIPVYRALQCLKEP